jgi:hypothetical protein
LIGQTRKGFDNKKVDNPFLLTSYGTQLPHRLSHEQRMDIFGFKPRSQQSSEDDEWATANVPSPAGTAKDEALGHMTSGPLVSGFHLTKGRVKVPSCLGIPNAPGLADERGSYQEQD